MATRLYYSASAPAVSPAVSGDWTSASNLHRASLKLSKDNSGQVVSSGAASAGSAWGVAWQLVSWQMAAGIVFTSGSTTIQGLALAYCGTTNNVATANNYRILSSNGLTVRAVIRGTSIYGGMPSSPSSQGFPGAAQTLLASYTTVAGDILVVEIGAGYNVADDTGTIQMSSLNADSDFTAVGQASGNPWIEFSNNITFLPVPNPIGSAPGAFGSLGASFGMMGAH